MKYGKGTTLTDAKPVVPTRSIALSGNVHERDLITPFTELVEGLIGDVRALRVRIESPQDFLAEFTKRAGGRGLRWEWIEDEAPVVIQGFSSIMLEFAEHRLWILAMRTKSRVVIYHLPTKS